MNFHQFNFAHAVYLWALILLPIVWGLFAWKRRKIGQSPNLERFADKHLLPHLLKPSSTTQHSVVRPLYLWSFIWSLGVLALAGPRWSFTDITAYKPSRSLVIALDLAKSMDTKDVQPSRLVRARQEIQDILDDSPDINIGVVGFAADAHLITPITEDKASIHYLLGALRTDLVYVPGSRLAPALNLAEQMLSTMPGKDKQVLVMGDGDFEDGTASSTVSALVARGIHVSTMGFGKDQANLHDISSLGKGAYFDGNAPFAGQKAFLSNLFGTPTTMDAANKTVRDWEPRFYVFLLPMLLLILPWFRRRQSGPSKRLAQHSAMAALVALAFYPRTGRAAEAAPLSNLFKNAATQGKDAVDRKDYATAIHKFKDPYRQGVAEYKAGQFAQAEAAFRGSQRSDVALDSTYNLGNALAQQAKYEEAISEYKKVLQEQPKHQRAQINLKIVEDLLKNQKNQAKNQQQQKQQQQKDGKEQQSQQTASNDQQSGQKSGQKSGQQNAQKNGQQKPGDDQSQKGSQTSEKNFADQKAPQPGDNSHPADSKDSQNSEKKLADQKALKTDHSPNPAGSTGPQTDEKNLADQKAPAQPKDAKQPGPERPGQPAKDDQKGEQPAQAQSLASSDQPREDKQRVARTPQDVDADLWLSHITSDPHEFLRNQFAVESMRHKARKGDQP